MNFNFFRRKENIQEVIASKSFLELVAYIHSLSPEQRPEPEIIFEEVYRLVHEVMPYDLKNLNDFDGEVIKEIGADGVNQTRKVALTHYFKLNPNDKAKAVCRHQALLAALLVEKLSEKGVLSKDTTAVRGSGIEFYDGEEHGHAWASISFSGSKDSKKREYIVDPAQETFGELTETERGSYVGGKECNSGESNTWSTSKLWPYQKFNKDYNLARSRYRFYSVAVEEARPDFIKTEPRHLITRETKLDKGYKWDGLGDAAVVLDWENHYTDGYQQIEERLSSALHKRIHSGNIQVHKLDVQNKPEGKITEEDVRAVRSFSELYDVIKKTDVIVGSNRTYTPEKMKEIIEDVRFGARKIEGVTSSFGLREKVAELLGIQLPYTD